MPIRFAPLIVTSFFDIINFVLKSRYIYIMLSKTGTLFSETIRVYTKDYYNHASLGLDEGLYNLYSFGRKTPKNPLIAGFIKEDIEGPYTIVQKSIFMNF